jgi:hypothetical protein
MRTGQYILAGKTPVECKDILTWGRWFEKAERHVGKTEQDGITVSTVFLGLDHNYGEGPPVLFETMIFGGDHNEYQERYCTWEEAEAGHEEACKLAFGDPKNKQPIKV